MKLISIVLTVVIVFAIVLSAYLGWNKGIDAGMNACTRAIREEATACEEENNQHLCITTCGDTYETTCCENLTGVRISFCNVIGRGK